MDPVIHWYVINCTVSKYPQEHETFDSYSLLSMSGGGI